MRKLIYLFFTTCLLFVNEIQAQYSGSVLDASSSEPLVGAVLTSGLKYVTTDANGHWTLDADKGSIVTVSYVGLRKTIHME